MNKLMNRRVFLKATGTVGATLIIGFQANGALAAGAQVLATGTDTASAEFNPYLKIDEQGIVTVISKHFEMGQGTTTGMATLVAEELDVPWDNVRVEFAPSNNELYKNLLFGSQGTGGSTAIANAFKQYRSAGATAKSMLIQAAADAWALAEDEVTLADGVLSAGGQSAPIGEFVAAASKLPPPGEVALKDPSAFKLIGADRLPRKDSIDKTDGSAMFAMDVKVPNMLYVTILRSPRFGGVLKSFDASAASDVNGFVDAKALPNNAGVAVYANSTWAAIKARTKINADWDDSAADLRGTPEAMAEHQGLLDAAPGYDATGQGNLEAVTSAVDGAEKTVAAEYWFPLLAHAPMEPLNCVIEPTETGVRVHDGCQFPAITHPTVAAVLQLPPEHVEIVTYYAGGSFGRRANATSDYHLEAALAYALMGGQKAIKLVWTREDDLAGGYYRPMVAHRAKIAIGEDGKVGAWQHRIATQSIAKGTPFESMIVHDGIDLTSVEGIADTPYRINNFFVGLSDYESPMPVLWLRSVGHTHSAYVMETLMDMAAEAAEADPVEFRLAHLDESDGDQARMAGVIKLAAEKSGWNGQSAAGKGRGLAAHKSFNSYVAQVAEVSVDDGGAISIDKIVCAVDCGVAVNPDVIRAQVESSVGYGLGLAMRNQITQTEGVIDQANFPQYQPLRIADMPEVEVHIMPSGTDPTGIGEPGLPPAAPAVANAIYQATGQRITKLPMSESGAKFS